MQLCSWVDQPPFSSLFKGEVGLFQMPKEVIAGSFARLLPPCLQNIFQGVCLVTLWSMWQWKSKVAHAITESKSKEQGVYMFIWFNPILFYGFLIGGQRRVIHNWKSWMHRPRVIYDDISNLTTWGWVIYGRCWLELFSLFHLFLVLTLFSFLFSLHLDGCSCIGLCALFVLWNALVLSMT